jgi:transmembrane sensor
MSSTVRRPDPPVSKRACIEAATWAVKLHGPERDSAMESGWRDWLAEHPDHPIAWENASDAWNMTHELPVEVVLPAVRLRRDILSRSGWARALVTVGACAAVAAVALVWHLFVDRSEVATGVGEQRAINLPDGTRIEINTNSRLSPQFDPQERRVVLESGEAHFSVAHEKRPFVVVAGAHKVIALGTSFMVRRGDLTDDTLTVTLIDGRVAVAPVTATDILPAEPLPQVTVLSAGQRLRMHRTAPPVVDTPPMERATGWMRGQVIFDHTALADAAAEMNRYSSLRIAIAPSAAGFRVGGSFQVGDSEAFARAAADSYNLTLRRQGDQILLGPADSPGEDSTSLTR